MQAGSVSNSRAQMAAPGRAHIRKVLIGPASICLQAEGCQAVAALRVTCCKWHLPLPVKACKPKKATWYPLVQVHAQQDGSTPSVRLDRLGLHHHLPACLASHQAYATAPVAYTTANTTTPAPAPSPSPTPTQHPCSFAPCSYHGTRKSMAPHPTPHTHATTITSVVPSHAPCSSASCLPPLHPPHAHRPYTHLAHTRKRTTHAPPTLEPLAGPARLSQLAQSNDALNSPGASGALRSDFGTTFCVGFQCLAKVWDTSSGKSTVASPVTWRPVAESRSSSRRRRRWGRRQQHA